MWPWPDTIQPPDTSSRLTDDSMPHPSVDVYAFYPTTEQLVPKDIWNKFEIDFTEYCFNDIFDSSEPLELPDSPAPPLIDLSICVIRDHDCMWTGQCACKERPSDDSRTYASGAIFPPVSSLAPPAAPRRDSARQQSLLKPGIRAAAAVAAHTPQTPPMSDDEEARSKPTAVLQILNQAISEYDLDDDSDLEDDSGLREYFGDGEDMDVNVTDIMEPEWQEAAQPYVRKYQSAAESDHSYHKDKNASMRMANLGIDTPSDSDEEIDVVSVGDRFTLANRMVSLPTNPSNRDRHHIQRRMATAMGKRKPSTGIKTILPIRKATVPEVVPAMKRKMQTESRGAKRSRQCKPAPASSYKKRALYRQSSDSEPEPSDKRNLHNNMEKQRRIELKNAFDNLRVVVPAISKKEGQVSKAVTLREATVYCNLLTNLSHGYTKQLDELKRHQERLRGRVSQLRRSLAAKR